MNYDIGDLLSAWQFDPEEFHARQIKSEDGVEKIQIRIDMGILQLEMQGRPDGQQPHGHISLLEYYENMLQNNEQKQDEEELFKAEGVVYLKILKDSLNSIVQVILYFLILKGVVSYTKITTTECGTS